MNSISDKYQQLGGPEGLLGPPLEAERDDGPGRRLRRFRRGLIRQQVIAGGLTVRYYPLALVPAAVPDRGPEQARIVPALIERLRQEPSDVIGLGGCYTPAGRDQLKAGLADLYPAGQTLAGPDEPAWPGQAAGQGGLILFSRYPLLAVHQTLFRQRADDEAPFVRQWGCLHARIQAPTQPLPTDLFLAQLQTPLFPDATLTPAAVLAAQLQHLRSFVRAYGSPRRPALLLGQLGIDAHDQALFRPLCPTRSAPVPSMRYETMLAHLDQPRDLWLAANGLGAGLTAFDPANSYPAHRLRRSPDDPHRFQHGRRSHYLLGWPGLDLQPVYHPPRRLVWQSCPGRDLSPDYGLSIAQAELHRFELETARRIRQVELALDSLHCLLVSAINDPPAMEAPAERSPADLRLQLRYQVTGPDWHDLDLSRRLELPPAAENSLTYIGAHQQRPHLVYRDQSGHLHLLTFLPTRDAWQTLDLTETAGAPMAEGRPVGYIRPDTPSWHLVYRGADGQLHELWARNDTRWTHRYLTGSPNPPPAAGDPTAVFWPSQNSQHVFYVSGDRRLHELRYTTGPAWQHREVTPPGGLPQPAGDPVSYVWDEDSRLRSLHLIYRGADDALHELWAKPNQPWQAANLTGITGAPAADGSPLAFVWESRRSQHVLYRGLDQHPHELRFDLTSGWSHHPLTGTANAPAALHPPYSYVHDPDGSRYVLYVGQDHHLHELGHDGTAWQHQDLTQAARSAAASGVPVGYSLNGRRDRLYLSQAGALHLSRYERGAGSAAGRCLSPEIEGVQTGHTYPLDDNCRLALGDPGDVVTLELAGWARGFSADHLVGRSVIQLFRSELLAQIGQQTRRVFPLLTGRGGEYAVTVGITVAGE